MRNSSEFNNYCLKSIFLVYSVKIGFLMKVNSANSKMLLKILAYTTFVLFVQEASSENSREVLFKNGPCMRHQFRCLNDNCISRHLLCDSKNDCGDNSDESLCSRSECPTEIPFFRCAYNRNYYYLRNCIPTAWKCDGIKDCPDNADENGCDFSKDSEITGGKIQIASNLSQTWILKGRKADRKLHKWGSDLPRKTVALYLSNKTRFESQNNFVDEIAYELTINFLSKMKIKTIEDFSTADIASYMNAFLVTCVNPRDFFELNLVKELRTRVDSMDGTNPFALLAMCNAKEVITFRDVKKLEEAFWTAYEKHRIDMMAVIILVLSCASNQESPLNVIDDKDLSNLVLKLKQMQYRNGTVQNVKTTALVLQALFASQQEPDEDNFDERKALHQIIRSQKADGSFGTIANTYYILPVLNLLTLVNISSEHCPKFVRDEHEGFERLKEQSGEKMNVKYSIWIGDKKFIQRTLTLTVPVNTSFYGTMEYASDFDADYRFQYNVIGKQPYIYSLHQMMDDPETEMYWSFNQLINETSEEVQTIHKSPVNVYPKNNDHYVYWYKSEE